MFIDILRGIVPTKEPFSRPLPAPSPLRKHGKRRERFTTETCVAVEDLLLEEEEGKIFWNC
jgi:hypothetical protein